MEPSSLGWHCLASSVLGFACGFFHEALTCCRLVGCCVWHGDGPVFLLINFLLETRTELFSWGSRAICETWVTVHALKNDYESAFTVKTSPHLPNLLKEICG